MKIEELPGAWVIEVFRRGGVDIAMLKQKLPDEVDTLIHRLDIITPDSVNLLLSYCSEQSGDQDFGLTMNERIDFTMYGLFGYLIINSCTVGDLLKIVERYYPLLYSGGDFYTISTQKDTLSIEYGTYQKPKTNLRHITEWSLGFFPYYLSQSLGELGRPIKTIFMHDSPTHCHKLQTVFGQNLEFNQTANKLTYRKSILNKKINNVDPGMLKILREQADKSLQSFLKNDTFLEKIKMLLIERVGEGNANATDIANELRLTLSTFKRKLTAENIDFRKTKESVKNELAKNMLSKTNVSISDIARKTGFSDQSSFTRFFIRCNTLTPQAYRNSDI